MARTAQRDKFKDWFVEQADLCIDAISQYAKLLYDSWVERGLGGNSHPDFLRADAKRVTTELAIDILVTRILKSTPPPPTDTTQPVPSISDTLEKMAPQVKRKKEENRQPNEPCNCKNKCAAQITQPERREICQKYWLIPSHERQEGYKIIGEIILHQPRDNLTSSRNSLCGAVQRKTFFFYKAKARVPVCQHFFLTSLGYHKNAHFPDLKTVPCAKCEKLKSSHPILKGMLSKKQEK